VIACGSLYKKSLSVQQYVLAFLQLCKMKEQKRLDYSRADKHYQNVYGKEELTANGENDMKSTLKNSQE